MKCQFCDDKKNVSDFDDISHHLIIVRRNDGSVHVHAPFDDSVIISDFIEKLIVESEKHGIIYKHRL